MCLRVAALRTALVRRLTEESGAHPHVSAAGRRIHTSRSGGAEGRAITNLKPNTRTPHDAKKIEKQGQAENFYLHVEPSPTSHAPWQPRSDAAAAAAAPSPAVHGPCRS